MQTTPAPPPRPPPPPPNLVVPSRLLDHVLCRATGILTFLVRFSTTPYVILRLAGEAGKAKAGLLSGAGLITGSKVKGEAISRYLIPGQCRGKICC
jgi:hypothetical protein